MQLTSRSRSITLPGRSIPVWAWRLGLLALIGVLAVSGPLTTPHRAEAQPLPIGSIGGVKQIDTFVIDPGSFQLRSRILPVIEIQEGATIYTLLTDGNLQFKPVGSTVRTLALDRDDLVIERPDSGALTVVRTL